MTDWGMKRDERIKAELERQKRKNASKEATEKREKKRKFWERMKDGG